MSLQKQLEYNKGLFICRVLNNEAPVYISTLYTHTPSRYSNSRNYQLGLPRPRIDIFKTGTSSSGAFLWNNLPLTVRSCQSLSSFKRKHRAHVEAVTQDGLWKNTARVRETDIEVFEWLPVQWLVIWDLLYTPTELRPVLPTACESGFLPPLPYCSL